MKKKLSGSHIIYMFQNFTICIDSFSTEFQDLNSFALYCIRIRCMSWSQWSIPSCFIAGKNNKCKSLMWWCHKSFRSDVSNFYTLGWKGPHPFCPIACYLCRWTNRSNPEQIIFLALLTYSMFNVLLMCSCTFYTKDYPLSLIFSFFNYYLFTLHPIWVINNTLHSSPWLEPN